MIRSWPGVPAAVALALAAVLVAGGGGTSASPSKKAASPSVAGRAASTDVTPLAIKVEGCTLVASRGTGFAVGGGLVVTVAHLIRGSKQITVEGYSAEPLVVDLRSDVSVLRVSSDAAASGSSGLSDGADTADAATGEPVVVQVFRDGEVTTLDATVVRTPMIHFEEPMDHTYYDRQGIFLDGLAIVKGDSGSPVVDSAGKVVGMVFATGQTRDRAYAVNFAEIRALLPRPDATPVDTGTC